LPIADFLYAQEILFLKTGFLKIKFGFDKKVGFKF
jgi:hypothetical protein